MADALSRTWKLTGPLGAASFLGDGGEVLFCHLFTPASLGRVSDLIAAYLEEEAVDDHALRLGVLLCARAALDFHSEQGVGDPVQLECGFDGVQLVVTARVSIIPGNAVKRGLLQWVDRLNAGGEIEGSVFAVALDQLRRISRQVVVREQTSSCQAEIAAVFATSSAGGTFGKESAPIVHLAFETPSDSASPSIRATELGDLDYAELLRSARIGKGLAPSPTGTYLKTAADEEEETETRIKGGRGEKGDRDTVIHGTTDSRTDEKVVVKRGPGAEAKDDGRFSWRSLFRKLLPARNDSPEAEGTRLAGSHVGSSPADRGESDNSGDLSRRAAIEIKQRDLQHRAAEQTLQTELRRKDEIIHQRDAIISRLKDQIDAASAQVDRLRKTNLESAGQLQWRYKHDQLQQTLAAARDENHKLVRRIEEYKNTLSLQHQDSINRSSDAISTKSDMSALQAKFDRSQKQVDELKKMNKQLMDRATLYEKRKSPDSTKYEDTRGKLEQAVKLANDRKHEIDALKLRCEEVEHDRNVAVGELRRLQMEIKARGSQTGGGDAPPQAA